MKEYNQQDRVRGCLVGGAVGDALGYPVEFVSSYQTIVQIYGEQGVTRFDTNAKLYNEHKAYISDDTQMTLFTACGILNAKMNGMAPVPAMCWAYLEWLYTQKGVRSKRMRNCWVGDLPEMNVRRGPGITCLNSLENILQGREPVNDSKGAGGLMRIAPIPLYGLSQGRITDLHALDVMAADASELTHLHPLGFIPSFVAAHLIYRLATDEKPTRESFLRYLEEALRDAEAEYGKYAAYVYQQRALVEKALVLADKGNCADHEAIFQIGEGWVAEEALAIAVYCTYKYFGDFEKSVVAAVNHVGDSDTTGAVTGNLHGAALGYEAIPEHFKTNLELHDVIVHVADDLWRGYTTRYTGK